MCWPIFISAASTVGNVLQARSPQTLNELIMPESAGVNGLLGGGTLLLPRALLGGPPGASAGPAAGGNGDSPSVSAGTEGNVPPDPGGEEKPRGAVPGARAPA